MPSWSSRRTWSLYAASSRPLRRRVLVAQFAINLAFALDALYLAGVVPLLVEDVVGGFEFLECASVIFHHLQHISKPFETLSHSRFIIQFGEYFVVPEVVID